MFRRKLTIGSKTAFTEGLQSRCSLDSSVHAYEKPLTNECFAYLDFFFSFVIDASDTENSRFSIVVLIWRKGEDYSSDLEDG